MMTAMGTVGLLIVMLILEIPPIKNLIKKLKSYAKIEKCTSTPDSYQTYMTDGYCVNSKQLIVHSSEKETV